MQTNVEQAVGRTAVAVKTASITSATSAADLWRLAPAMIYLSASAFYLQILARGSVAFEGRTYFTLFDDAMISMRYARTLVAGGGFTWNPGETPIEGITNPLWTLWMALMHLAPVPEGYVALLVGLSSAVCLLATARAAQCLATMLGASEKTSLAVLASVAFYYPLAFWSLRGMETGVLACLMTWAMVLALRQLDAPDTRRAAMLGAIAAALVLVRQDAVVFIAVLAGFMGIAGGKAGRVTTTALLGGMTAGLAMLLGGRFAYYGEILPNTYYLKVTGVTLAERLHRGLAVLFSEEMRGHLVVFAAVLVLSVPGLLRSERRSVARMALPLAAFLAQCVYSVYVGGDVWELMGYPNRYLAIAMPGLIALALALLGTLVVELARGSRGGHGDVGQGAMVGAAVFFGVAGLMLVQTSAKHAVVALRDGPAYVEFDRAATQVGLCLREHTRGSVRIAYTWAGSMPYYADRFGIDLLGKLDPQIARGKPQIAFEPGHNKWDYAYSIDTHKPDIVLQLFRATPAEHQAIRARGYEPVERTWPCLANTFLTPEDVYVRGR